MGKTKDRFSSVNFGGANGSLSTVGYTLYKASDQSVFQARSTTGVTELGTNTGIYGAKVSVNNEEDVIIVWDTGDATPIYAQDHMFSQLNQIQDKTDLIRILFNTIKNQSDFQGEIMLRLAKLNDLEFNPNQLEKDIGKAFKETLSEFNFSDQFKESNLSIGILNRGQSKIDKMIQESQRESMSQLVMIQKSFDKLKKENKQDQIMEMIKNIPQFNDQELINKLTDIIRVQSETIDEIQELSTKNMQSFDSQFNLFKEFSDVLNQKFNDTIENFSKLMPRLLDLSIQISETKNIKDSIRENIKESFFRDIRDLEKTFSNDFINLKEKFNSLVSQNEKIISFMNKKPKLNPSVDLIPFLLRNK